MDLPTPKRIGVPCTFILRALAGKRERSIHECLISLLFCILRVGHYLNRFYPQVGFFPGAVIRPTLPPSPPSGPSEGGLR